MYKIATITSKKQITLPARLFKKAGFTNGQKVLVSEEDGKLIITSVIRLVEDLAGSVLIPQEWKNKTLEQITQESKTNYLKAKCGLK